MSADTASAFVEPDGSGDGSGYGSGYGDGDGSGSGYGDGDGSGYGDGYGDGDGSGSGYGDGDGSGYGDGYGELIGSVSAYEVRRVCPGVVRIGCQLHTVAAWRDRWSALAAEHGVSIHRDEVERLLGLAG